MLGKFYAPAPCQSRAHSACQAGAELIADQLRTEGDEICFSMRSVQMQVGAADCGLFALAFTTAVVHGYDPTEL